MKRLFFYFTAIFTILSCAKEENELNDFAPMSINSELLANDPIHVSEHSLQHYSSCDSFVYKAFQSIQLNQTIVEEVAEMVSKSLHNGFDECFFLREMYEKPSNVKISIPNGVPALKKGLENYFASNPEHINRNGEDYLSHSNLVIYWPYYDMWDGKTLPTITFMPDNCEKEWNYGYKASVTTNNNVVKEIVIVDEEYAQNNPVWIIKESEFNYESLPNFNIGEYEKNGVFFSVPETKSYPDTIHIWKMASAQVTKQYDSFFQGSSNLAITVTYPVFTGVVNDYSLIYTAFTRSEIRQRIMKPVNLMLNTDWIPQELSNGLFVVETDGGETETDSITTQFKDPETGLEFDYTTSISYKDEDDKIGKIVYKRSYVFSSQGQTLQSMDDGGFNFYMTINEVF